MLRCSWQAGLQLGGAKRIATVARKVDLDHSATLALMRDCSWRLLNALWQVSEEKNWVAEATKLELARRQLKAEIARISWLLREVVREEAPQ